MHKLVTGRAADFGGLRQAGGLSGYPNRAESVHDLWRTATPRPPCRTPTAWPGPGGCAGCDRPVVAVVGDGALTGGLAYEALNNIGAAGDPGAGRPERQRPLLRADGLAAVRRPRAGRRAGDPTAPAGFFERPRHRVPRARSTATTSATSSGPCARWPLRRGPGRAPRAHGEGPRLRPGRGRRREVPARRRPLRPGHRPSAASPGPGAATPRPSAGRCWPRRPAGPTWSPSPPPCPGRPACSRFAERYPDRFFDVGIAEQHAVTAAAGMAMAGLRPVVAIYSTFLNRAWDQVYYDVGLHRLPVVFCLDRAGVTGDDGPSHHGLLDLALLDQGPGDDRARPLLLRGGGRDAGRRPRSDTGPVAIRWPKTEAPGRDHRARARGPAGPPRERRLPDRGGQAARRLRGGGGPAGGGRASSASVWDPRCVAPLDPAHAGRRRRAPGGAGGRGRGGRGWGGLAGALGPRGFDRRPGALGGGLWRARWCTSPTAGPTTCWPASVSMGQGSPTPRFSHGGRRRVAGRADRRHLAGSSSLDAGNGGSLSMSRASRSGGNCDSR